MFLRNRLLACLSLLFISVAYVSAGNHPKLKLDSLSYELGDLEIDSVFHEVNVCFVNEGDADLIFYKPRVSCECLKVEVPKEPVPAGKSGKIRVLLDMSSFYTPNRHVRSMMIYTNDRHPQTVDFNFQTLYKTTN